MAFLLPNSLRKIKELQRVGTDPAKLPFGLHPASAALPSIKTALPEALAVCIAHTTW
jgi:hypothetical protein